MIKIRDCSNNDFDMIVILLQQLWPDKSLNINSLKIVYDKAISSDNQKYICAVEDGKVIGFGSLTIKNNLWQEGNLGHIDELVVDNGSRGKGVGSILLKELIKIAKEINCRRIELDTAFHRKDAHRFYENQGFENRAYLFSMVL